MMKNKSVMLIITGLFIIGMLIILVYSNTNLTITKYNLKYSNLPSSFDNFKIVHLSDLHNVKFGGNNEKLIAAIEEQLPDIIVMTGDMINSRAEGADMDVFISLLQQLANKYKVLFVDGNHEQDISKENLSLLRSKLKEAGVHMLDNEVTSVAKEGQRIDIYGMTWFNLHSGNDNENIFNPERMDEIIGESDNKNFSILLTHDPAFFDVYREWGADLTLSGHIHGGMIRLPFIGGIFSPDGELFPKYDAGLFTYDDKRIVISRGLGNGNRGIRFLNPPEIVVISLQQN